MECVQWKEGQHHEVDLTPAPGSAPQDFAAVPDEPEPTTGSTYAASVASVSVFFIFSRFSLYDTVLSIQESTIKL